MFMCFPNYFLTGKLYFHVLELSLSIDTLRSLGVPQDCNIGPLQFNADINAVCSSVCNCSRALLADDLKSSISLEMLRSVKSCS
jgi:hypothetical protein